MLKLKHPLPPALWFILLYLLGFGGLTLLALLLKTVMNGLM